MACTLDVAREVYNELEFISHNIKEKILSRLSSKLTENWQKLAETNLSFKGL